MFYLVIAAMVYGWTALDLVRHEPPEDFREALGVVLLCTVIAALWPTVGLWRLLLGPRATSR